MLEIWAAIPGMFTGGTSKRPGGNPLSPNPHLPIVAHRLGSNRAANRRAKQADLAAAAARRGETASPLAQSLCGRRGSAFKSHKLVFRRQGAFHSTGSWYDLTGSDSFDHPQTVYVFMHSSFAFQHACANPVSCDNAQNCIHDRDTFPPFSRICHSTT